MREDRPWLLGLEMSPRSSGALQFARWLRGMLGARIVGVYVHELWAASMPPGEGAAFTRAFRDETVKWMASLDPGEPGSPVDETRVIDDLDAENGLATAAQGAPGLIVGRRVARETLVVRLGRVTRRLLRRLPAPVIVAPPELAVDTLHGPVVLASDFSEASATAAKFAVRFALRVNRPLVCVHVDEPRWDEPIPEHDPRWNELRLSWKVAAELAAREWASAHCPGNELVVEFGDPAARLVAVAARLGACLLVVGSHRPGMLERIFLGSTASAVAATAGCAVAVVPADAPADTL